MADNKAPRPEKKPPIPHSKYKPSPAARTQAAFSQLCQVLEREWAHIRCMNLGVKSGTAVVEEVLLSQCHQLASTVHMLAVTDAGASKVLVAQAARLSPQQFQNLQVLLDVLALEELSDFLHLMCCHLRRQHRHDTHHANSSSSGGGGGGGNGGGQGAGHRPSSCATTGSAAAGRLTSAGILKNAGTQQAAEAGSSGLTTRQRRMRAAAGVFELAQADFSDSPDSWQQGEGGQQQLQQQRGTAGALFGGSASPEPSPLGLRFAHLLPPGHILVKTAESLKQQQEFRAALAHVAPRQAKQQRAAVPPLHLPPPAADQEGMLQQDVFQQARLPGYHHYHPNDFLGPSAAGTTPWQQQHHQGDGSTTPSTPGGHDGSSGSDRGHVAAVGPWRGSLLEGCDLMQSDLLQHQYQHQQHQQQQQHQAGAFFLSSYGGSGGQASLFQATLTQRRHAQQQQLAQQRQQFRAPGLSLERLWKDGRQATTAAVLGAARLPVHESPGDDLSLLLVPGLTVVQQQQQAQSPEQQLSTPEAAAATGGGSKSKLASRRASAAASRRASTAANCSSRPDSARNARPSSATVPALQLHQLDGTAGELSGRPGSGSSSRPGSAVPTSRLGVLPGVGVG